MLSKEYFLYLLKSRKYLLILIALVSLLNVLGNQMVEVMLLLQALFSILLSFAIPMDVFYHVHSKKAVDTYFSLPVSRKKLLWTGIFFSFLVVVLPACAGLIRYDFAHHDLNLLLMLAETILISLTVVIFNTTLYLIGNNLIDGVVMMGAYTYMPLAVLWIINSFIRSYVAGLHGGEFFQIRFLSPLYLGLFLLDSSYYGENMDIASLIGMFVILGIFIFLLQRSYVERDAERADSQSTAFLSYPFVIYFYVIVCLFLIASMYSLSYENIFGFLGDYFFLYVMLFAVFVAAHFLYRRKFYFSYKLPLFYVIAMIVTLSCSSLFLNHKAFGLSERYEIAQGKDYITINGWFEADSEIYRFIKETNGSDPEYVQVLIEIGHETVVGDDMNYFPEMSEETSAIVDEYRRKAIEYFYEEDYDLYACGSMMINSRSGIRYYQYSLKEFPDLEALKKLAEDKAVRITISTVDREYRMKSDGTLMLTQIYN